MFDRKLLKKDAGPLIADFLAERPDLAGELNPDVAMPDGSVEDTVSTRFLRPWLAWLDKNGHVDRRAVESLSKALAERFPDAWAEAGAPPAPQLLVAAVGPDLTDDDLVDRMRTLRSVRASGVAHHLFCTVGGPASDPRVQAFCRRLCRLGFVACLDPVGVLENPGVFGAVELWLAGRGEPHADAADPAVRLSAGFVRALAAAAAEADRVCGPVARRAA